MVSGEEQGSATGNDPGASDYAVRLRFARFSAMHSIAMFLQANGSIGFYQSETRFEKVTWRELAP